MAKGLFLPSEAVLTWQVDANGEPTHDQGAKLLKVDLVDCVAVFIDEDGRASLGASSDAVDVVAFEAAALRHDGRLWFGESLGWTFG